MLLEELRMKDANSYRHYLRMNTDTFQASKVFCFSRVHSLGWLALCYATCDQHSVEKWVKITIITSSCYGYNDLIYGCVDVVRVCKRENNIMLKKIHSPWVNYCAENAYKILVDRFSFFRSHYLVLLIRPFPPKQPR